jgi:serine protease Do
MSPTKRHAAALAALLLVSPVTAACSRSAAKEGTGAAQEVTREVAAPRDTLLPAPPQGAIDASRRNAIVTAAQRVSPAVVSINTVVRQRVVPRSVWEEMMLPPGATRESASLGSGFIVDESGLVVTNEHVVRDATQITVTLPDGREYGAAIVGTDELSDLAVLRLKLGSTKEKLPVATLGNSDGLLIGEWVIAIGNPLGFYLANTEPTVTAGVVSGVGRNLVPSGQGSEQRGYYLDMIQTDASINPGNSGGPLVNAVGQVVGVNSSILSRSGGSEGLGFAIPINRVRRVVRDLVQDGHVRHAWIGADVEAVPADGARRTVSVRVAGVVPGSPAERAGLREGMVVSQVDGRLVRTPLDWRAALMQAQVGAPLDVRVSGGGAARVVRVTPADLPSVSAERVDALQNLQLVTLTPGIRAERSIRSEQGALIVSLTDAARQAGLQEGDVILQINRIRVRTAEDAARLLQGLDGRGAVVFLERGGQIGSVQW